ncbi:MAG: hypothetical protein COU85_00010, partial [Candidatus Portnoybacteria bacterium CG10_big_fil_rev_8_21_14_0_10_44_7]
REKAFIALGHILHLIEDLGVPAHTRADAHPLGDPYESWARDNVGEFNFNVAAIKINNLNGFFDDLAFYTHDNFLSKDTISDLKNKNIYRRWLNERDYVECVKGIDYFGSSFCLILIEKSILNNKYIIDKPLVHADYFSLIAPKVVAYGAGVVDLFIKEAEQAKLAKEQEAKSWWEKLKNTFSNLSRPTATIAQPINSRQSAIQVSPDNNPQPEQDSSGQASAPNQNNQVKNTNQASTSTSAPLAPPDQNKPLQSPPLPSPKNEASNNSQPPDQEDQGGNNQNNFEILPVPESSSSSLYSAGGGPSPDNNQSPATPAPSSQIAPGTNIGSGPANPTNQTSATFAFSADMFGCTFQCKIDNQPEENCVSSKTYQALNEGQHTFWVYAVDANNNQDPTPASYTWQIDYSGPQSGNIQTITTQNSATINFESDEQAKSRIFWGPDTNYGQVTSQSANFALSHGHNLSGLEPETTYHFAIETADQLGNVASGSDNTLTTDSAWASAIVISEIQAAGSGGADDEWVELYNPTNQNVDLGGYSLQYLGSSANNFQKRNLAPGASIAASGFYLIANAGYAGTTTPDLAHNSFSLSAAGGTIFLVNDQTELTASADFTHVIDRIAYGTGARLYPEDSVFAPAPAVGQSAERKATNTSSAAGLHSGDEKYKGNGWDTDRNNQDFVLQLNPGPQNSASPKEPRAETDIVFGEKHEVVSVSTGPTDSVNRPKIITTDNGPEVIWQKNGAVTNDLYNKKQVGGAWETNQRIVSQNETSNQVLTKDAKIFNHNGQTYAFFVAQPAGQPKMLFMAEKNGLDWDAPASITAMSPTDSGGWDAVFGHSDNFHLVWDDRFDGGIKYQKCVLQPAIVCAAAENLNQTNINALKILLDAAAAPHIFYWRVNEKDIRERILSDGAWSDNLVFTTNQAASNYAYFDISADNSANFHLGLTQERGNNLWDYFYARKSNNLWSSPEKIEEGMGQRDAIVVRGNTEKAYVLSVNAGENYRELNLWQKENEEWHAPQKIANQNQIGDYTYPDMRLDPAGKLHIVWKSSEANFTSRIYYQESE